MRHGKPRECHFCGHDCGEAFSTITNTTEARLKRAPKPLCIKCTLRIENARTVAAEKFDSDEFRAVQINPQSGELFRPRPEEPV
jgi:hypothetical protein